MGIANRLIICGLILIPLLAQAALININTAGSTELQTLVGIGPTYAQRIIDYRNLHGPFQKIDDIKNVSGIGDVTFGKIKDLITVGDVAPPPETATATESATTTPPSDTTVHTVISDTSSHYSSAPVTRSDPPIIYKIGAGRDRLTSVGTPVEFKANSEANYTLNNSYSWSFGDGSVAYGPVVSHVYVYPGEYIVVLNAAYSGVKAVSRANVKVVPADLSISFASPERIEIKNNGTTEINLMGRSLSAFGQTFKFPEDTIIKAAQKISFASAVTNLSPITTADASLIMVDGNNKITTKPQAELVQNTDQANIDIIYAKILALEIQEMNLKNKEISQVASPVLAVE